MTAIVIALRVASLLVFAAPMLLLVRQRREGSAQPQAQSVTQRIPVIANFVAVGVFLYALLVHSGGLEGEAALAWAASGFLLAALGAVVVFWSRVALGAAWRLVPAADEATGLVTTGPYRVVRHPMYLGFLMLAAGEAVAFGSGLAVLVVAAGVAPTFVWRALVEERALARVFGDRYVAYRKRTRLLLPYLV